MKTSLITILMVLVLSACEPSEHKHRYMVTERGILSYSHGYCELGMLLNNDRDNILDEDSNPITCSGYVSLTSAEADAWGLKKSNPYDGGE